MALSRILLLPVLIAAMLCGCITWEEPDPAAAAPNLDKRRYDLHKAMSFRLGDLWVVRPPNEINATGLVITRTNLSLPGATEEEAAAPPPPETETEPVAETEAPAEADVSQAELEAQRGPQPKAADPLAPNQQRLSIDLVTGRATFRDTDGRVYPQQIDRNVAQRLHTMIADRAWQVRPPAAAQDAEPLYQYKIDIYNADYRYVESVTWHVPAKKPLPPSLDMLVGTFDVAYRYAYPLSEDINLLQ